MRRAARVRSSLNCYQRCTGSRFTTARGFSPDRVRLHSKMTLNRRGPTGGTAGPLWPAGSIERWGNRRACRRKKTSGSHCWKGHREGMRPLLCRGVYASDPQGHSLSRLALRRIEQLASSLRLRISRVLGLDPLGVGLVSVGLALGNDALEVMLLDDPEQVAPGLAPIALPP
jgi:hypothetical protein